MGGWLRQGGRDMAQISGYKIKLKQQVFLVEGMFNAVFLVWPWVPVGANMICTLLYSVMLRERCAQLAMTM